MLVNGDAWSDGAKAMTPHEHRAALCSFEDISYRADFFRQVVRLGAHTRPARGEGGRRMASSVSERWPVSQRTRHTYLDGF